ncbi:uncharacterized protein PAC_12928 [Phialocephala subalpina]|uniref:Uncharacterized protein n=1 Tax=Phialocephala subalpina TaxID=576137 RepID=A0A1L7XDD3_9HELO|nr:uncharacterized protein PAC_12928 [Phialocephala subalpina]
MPPKQTQAAAPTLSEDYFEKVVAVGMGFDRFKRQMDAATKRLEDAKARLEELLGAGEVLETDEALERELADKIAKITEGERLLESALKLLDEWNKRRADIDERIKKRRELIQKTVADAFPQLASKLTSIETSNQLEFVRVLQENTDLISQNSGLKHAMSKRLGAAELSLEIKGFLEEVHKPAGPDPTIVGGLQKTAQRLNEENANLRTLVKEWQDRVGRRDATIAREKEKGRKLQDELNALKVNSKDDETTRKRLEKDLEVQRKKVEKLEQKVSAREVALESYGNQVEELQNSLDQVESQLETRSNELATANGLVRTKESELLNKNNDLVNARNDLSVKERELKNATRDLNTSKQDLTSIQQDLENKQQELKDFQQALSNKEQDVQNLLTSSKMVLTKQSRMNEEAAIMGGHIGDLRKDVDSLRDDVKDARGQRDEMCRQRDEAEKSRDETSNALTQTSTRLNAVETARSKLKNKYTGLKIIYDSWKRQYTDLQATSAEEIQGLAEQVEDLGAQIEEYEGTIRNLEEANDEFRDSNWEYADDVAALKKQLEDLRTSSNETNTTHLSTIGEQAEAMTKLKTESAAAAEEHKRVVESHAKKTDQWEADKKSLDKEIEDLRANVKQLQARSDDWKEKAETTQAEVERLKPFENKSAELDNKLKGLQGIQAVSATVKEENERLKVEEQAAKDLRQEKLGWGQERVSLQSRIDSMTETGQRDEAEVERLKPIETQAKELLAQQSQWQEEKIELDGKIAYLEPFENKYRQLETTNSSLQADLRSKTTIANQVPTLAAEMQKLQQKEGAYKQEIRQLTSTNEGLTAEKQRLDQSSKEWERQAGNFKQERDTALLNAKQLREVQIPLLEKRVEATRDYWKETYHTAMQQKLQTTTASQQQEFDRLESALRRELKDTKEQLLKLQSEYALLHQIWKDQDERIDELDDTNSQLQEEVDRLQVFEARLDENIGRWNALVTRKDFYKERASKFEAEHTQLRERAEKSERDGSTVEQQKRNITSELYELHARLDVTDTAAGVKKIRALQDELEAARQSLEFSGPEIEPTSFGEMVLLGLLKAEDLEGAKANLSTLEGQLSSIRVMLDVDNFDGAKKKIEGLLVKDNNLHRLLRAIQLTDADEGVRLLNRIYRDLTSWVSEFGTSDWKEVSAGVSLLIAKKENWEAAQGSLKEHNSCAAKLESAKQAANEELAKVKAQNEKLTKEFEQLKLNTVEKKVYQEVLDRLTDLQDQGDRMDLDSLPFQQSPSRPLNPTASAFQSNQAYDSPYQRPPGSQMHQGFGVPPILPPPQQGFVPTPVFRQGPSGPSTYAPSGSSAQPAPYGQYSQQGYGPQFQGYGSQPQFQAHGFSGPPQFQGPGYNPGLPQIGYHAPTPPPTQPAYGSGPSRPYTLAPPPAAPRSSPSVQFRNPPPGQSIGPAPRPYEFLVSGFMIGGTRAPNVLPEYIQKMDAQIAVWQAQPGKGLWSTWTSRSGIRCVDVRRSGTNPTYAPPANDPNGQVACKRCVNRRLLCVMVAELGLPAVVPLPVSDRSPNANAMTRGYYIKEE